MVVVIGLVCFCVFVFEAGLLITYRWIYSKYLPPVRGWPTVNVINLRN